MTSKNNNNQNRSSQSSLKKIAKLENELSDLSRLREENQILETHLRKIYQGKLWRLLQIYFRFRDFLFNIAWNLKNNHRISSEFPSVITKISCIKPIEQHAISKQTINTSKLPRFSLICTELNEEKNLSIFLKGILNQDYLPDEFVIVDGGSTDKSVDIINRILVDTPIKYKLIVAPNTNISAGRNIALKNCHNNTILSIDAGCIVRDSQYFKKLISPFIDPEVDLTGGITYPVSQSKFNHFFIPNYQSINYHEFLPSTRSVAFKKDIAARIGFFDEFLTTGEDTMFDILYRRHSKKWVIVKDAVIYWRGPANENQCQHLLQRYSKGDGLSGFGFLRFGHVRLNKIKDIFTKAQLDGFWQGFQIRVSNLLNNKPDMQIHTYLIDDYVTLSKLLNETHRDSIFSIIIVKESFNFWPDTKQNYFDTIDFKNTDIWSNRIIYDKQSFENIYSKKLLKSERVKFIHNNKHINQNAFFSLLSIKTYNLNIFRKIRKIPKKLLNLIYYLNIFDYIKIVSVLKRSTQVIVITPVVDWKIPLKQRYQHLSEALANKGATVFYCTPNYQENIHITTQLKTNLYLTNKYQFLKLITKNAFYVTYSGDKKMTYQNIGVLLENNKVVYEYIDEISSDIIGDIPDSVFERHHKILKNEEIFISVSASKLLEEVKQIRSENIKLITNGVDIDHFISGNPTLVKDESIINFTKNKKVIGYFGAFAKWFDYQLLTKIAHLLPPEYVILLIGWDYDGSITHTDIPKLKNVKIVGPIDYQILPNYASMFDICTILFLINDVTKSTSPIKLFEYMALKKPIITTPLPECLKYNSPIIIKTASDFILKIKSIDKLPPSYFADLEKESTSNSWAHKAELMIKLINQ